MKITKVKVEYRELRSMEYPRFSNKTIGATIEAEIEERDLSTTEVKDEILRLAKRWVHRKFEDVEREMREQQTLIDEVRPF